MYSSSYHVVFSVQFHVDVSRVCSVRFVPKYRLLQLVCSSCIEGDHWPAILLDTTELGKLGKTYGVFE